MQDLGHTSLYVGDYLNYPDIYVDKWREQRGTQNQRVTAPGWKYQKYIPKALFSW